MRQKAAGWHFTTCVAEAPFSQHLFPAFPVPLPVALISRPVHDAILIPLSAAEIHEHHQSPGAELRAR
jgi:hypothetical protein